MASKVPEVFEVSEKNLQYVERLLYDVLVYTLPICGFPETSLPTTNCEENTYKFSNFVESAGAAVLTRCLAIRNEWAKDMWVAMLSQENSGEIDYDFIALFFNKIFSRFHQKEVPVTRNFIVEMSLAFCNEIMLFTHLEKIDIDFNKFIKSVSKFIAGAIAPHQNVSEITGELFIEFDNLSSYTKWIIDFIIKFAVPYGSRDDVPELLNEHFKKLWQAEFGEPTLSDTPLVIKQKTCQEFAPSQVLKDISDEESVPLPESAILESVLQDHEPSKSLKLPESSEIDALGDQKSGEKLSTRSANVSDRSSQSGQCSKNSSEVLGIEDDFGQMSLGAKGAHDGSQGAIPKRKIPEQEKPIRKSC